jgi:eukaryotic-like serine/threonine-protein kinase
VSKVFTITEGLENMGAIRTGGQGSVYKGRRVGEIITAIKLLPTPIFTQDESDKHYCDFINEVKKLQRVNEEPNPNVVKILSYGVSETGGFPFIEMEYIDGPDLGELLKPPHQPVFTIKETIKVAEQLSNALAHCHKLDVKHGDIKSNNVKYNKHTGNYVLLDFGLAILSDEERRTSLRQAGAIEFMAPEQNEGRMFFETDVYSFGIILYELLAGKVPFPLDGNSETARNKVMVAHMEMPPPDLLSLRASMLPTDWPEEKKALEMQVPEWLVKLIYTCLEKSPEARFRNGVALQEFISHHRIYTPEVAGIVKSGDEKWQSVVAEKDFELQDLKAIISRQDKELQMMRQKAVSRGEAPVNAERNMVSKAAFNALLIVLFLVGGLAIYGFFFNTSVVGAANADDNSWTISDSLSVQNEQSNLAILENRRAAKEKKKKEEKKQQQANDSATAQKVTSTQEQNNGKPVQKDSMASEAANADVEEEPAEEDNTENDNTAKNKDIRYKVRNKAYFHNEPDESTRRDAFIVHWNNAVLKPLEEKNGFIYIVFTNHLGQVSKGWLSKSDLIQVK